VHAKLGISVHRAAILIAVSAMTKAMEDGTTLEEVSAGITQMVLDLLKEPPTKDPGHSRHVADILNFPGGHDIG
jgi:hypothetical protein